jgi:hypothetical protein
VSRSGVRVHQSFRLDIAEDIEPREAASRLGFDKYPDFYLLEDAVVAFIVLERVERKLPAWTGSTNDGDFVTERHFRDISAIPHRKVAVPDCPERSSPRKTPTLGLRRCGRACGTPKSSKMMRPIMAMSRNNWRKYNGHGYLEESRRLRPDVQRRVSELLATLGPRISAAEEAFARRYG